MISNPSNTYKDAKIMELQTQESTLELQVIKLEAEKQALASNLDVLH